MLTSLKAKSMAAAKSAKYSGAEATAGMRNAKRAKLLNAVDPHGLLDEAERNRRADALLRSQMLALVDAREKKRQAKANAAIRAIAQPATGCSYCGPIGHASHRTCKAHAVALMATHQK